MNEKPEEKFLAKNKGAGKCPFSIEDCDIRCGWNQGDWCMMFDIRNDLSGIRSALEAILRNMPKER